MPRVGRHAAGIHALSVRQCFRQLDVARTLETDRGRGGRDLGRADAGRGVYVRVVVYERGPVELDLLEADVRQLGRHRPVQRQPVAAVRRVLHPVGRVGSAESARAVLAAAPPVAGALVPGSGHVRPAARSGDRPRLAAGLRGGVADVPAVRPGGNPVVPARRASAARLASRRPVAYGAGGVLVAGRSGRAGPCGSGRFRRGEAKCRRDAGGGGWRFPRPG
jgi:hypothetical protein